MKRKSICLLAGLLIASTAGMATATAFIIKDAQSTTTSESVKGTLVLAYGEESTWGKIEQLSPTNPKFSTIELKAPIRSASVDDEVEFSLTLKANDNCSIEGLTIKVATVDWQTDTSASNHVVGTLSSASDGTTKYTETITLTGSETKTYYLKSGRDCSQWISQSAYDEYVKLAEAGTESQAITQNFGGTLTAHYGKKVSD